MLITVFTPLYNRKELIQRLFQSLCRQNCKDFEWVVVDDGSTDRPEELFGSICNRENGFRINFIRQENGGKHRAINRGLKSAEGDFFLICDSDDYLTDDAIEKVKSFIMESQAELDESESKLIGVSGMRITPDGKYLLWKFDQKGNLDPYGGKPMFDHYIDSTMAETPSVGLYGDKAEVFRTEILRKYPFPEFEGENFMTEMVVWNRLSADGLKIRFFRDPIMICEYCDGGLTEQGNSKFINNPKGYGLYLREDIYNQKIQSQIFKTYYFQERDKITEREIAENLGLESCDVIKADIINDYRLRMDEIDIMMESAAVLNNISDRIESNRNDDDVLNQMNILKDQVRMLLTAKIHDTDEIEFVMSRPFEIVRESLENARKEAEKRIRELQAKTID